MQARGSLQNCLVCQSMRDPVSKKKWEALKGSHSRLSPDFHMPGKQFPCVYCSPLNTYTSLKDAGTAASTCIVSIWEALRVTPKFVSYTFHIREEKRQVLWEERLLRAGGSSCLAQGLTLRVLSNLRPPHICECSGKRGQFPETSPTDIQPFPRVPALNFPLQEARGHWT